MAFFDEMDDMFNKKTFNSAAYTESAYGLATGMIHYTTLVFERENVAARIEAKGFIEFLDSEGHLLDSIELPEEVDGRGVYESVTCVVQPDSIVLRFPIVEWIDNYPHCDGEYDRWDTQTIGHHTVIFDRQTNKASMG